MVSVCVICVRDLVWSESDEEESAIVVARTVVAICVELIIWAGAICCAGEEVDVVVRV